MLREKLLTILRTFNIAVLPRVYVSLYKKICGAQGNIFFLYLPCTSLAITSRKLEENIRKKITLEHVLKNLPAQHNLPHTEILNWRPELDNSRILNSAKDYRADISSNQYLHWFGSEFIAHLTVSIGRSFWRIETMRQLRKSDPELFRGTVLEVGAGTAQISSQISRFTEISKIYSLDYDEYTVKNLMPLVQSSLNAETSKIIRVLGSYNKMDLPTASIDAVIAVGAMHHSEDLDATMRECYRVLKPGGKFIVSDYSLTNTLSQEEYSVLMNLPKKQSDAAEFIRDPINPNIITNKSISEHPRPSFMYQTAAFNAGFNLDITFFDATKDNGGSLARLIRRLKDSIRVRGYYDFGSVSQRVHGYDSYGNVRAFNLAPRIRYPAYAQRAPSFLKLLFFGDYAGHPVYDNMLMVLTKPKKNNKKVTFKYPNGAIYNFPSKLDISN